VEEIMTKMRWYPMGPASGPFEPILKNDLDKIAEVNGAIISVEEIVNKNSREVGGVTIEETMGVSLEDITQTVVTVSSRDEGGFRQAIRALINKYGSPRSTYATWGSNERGKWIVGELCDEEDGWS